jgi:uncharacterized protein YbjT (DUF2867 family)
MIYVIAGATGHVGGTIAGKLLGSGRTVRVISRTGAHLKNLVKKGAEPCVGPLEDRGFLEKAFSGADAVFTLIPPNPVAADLRGYQNEIGDSIAAAIRNTGVRYAVNLSSVGAQMPERTGPVMGLRDMEQKLNSIDGLNVVHLRPTFFMENLLYMADLIKNKGIVAGSVRGDLKSPMIATRDIGEVAASLLLDYNATGKSAKYLLGERDISMSEATAIIGKAIKNRGLTYVQVSYDDEIKALTGMGLSRDVARAYAELSKAANEGWLLEGISRTPESTTKTSFEDFVRRSLGVFTGKKIA